MKKTIHFSKAFLPSWIISGAIILFGVIGLFVKGINFGIDFKPGLIEEIKVAPTALELTYTGTAKVAVDLSQNGIDFVISGTGADNRTESFLYVDYPTLGVLASQINAIDGMHAKVCVAQDTSSAGLFVSSAVSTVVTEKPFSIFASGTDIASIDEVRDSLHSFEGLSVKEVGSALNRSFQIRMADSGEEGANKKMSDSIISALEAKFGKNNIAVVKTDFIGSQFSRTLSGQALILAAAALLLIWLYATVRFHWDFALGSIVALLHDTMIMITFITWTQMEFSTTTMAAILAIIGYSINATVVILDRVRSDLKILDVHKFTEILDTALTETLSRSVITTITTMFSALSLYVFLTGSIKDFALILIVGLISGCYSSMCISSGLIAYIRRNWKPEAGVHHALKVSDDGSHVIPFKA
ncbi:MAG: protein translocase subunit SecF [Treponema sp.]|nr:protein translocase subunit SecF [Treponema sp.]